jgi:hypothetical protein
MLQTGMEENGLFDLRSWFQAAFGRIWYFSIALSNFICMDRNVYVFIVVCVTAEAHISQLSVEHLFMWQKYTLENQECHLSLGEATLQALLVLVQLSESPYLWTEGLGLMIMHCTGDCNDWGSVGLW